MCLTLPELLSLPKKEEITLQKHEEDTQWYYKSK